MVVVARDLRFLPAILQALKSAYRGLNLKGTFLLVELRDMFQPSLSVLYTDNLCGWLLLNRFTRVASCVASGRVNRYKKPSDPDGAGTFEIRDVGQFKEGLCGQHWCRALVRNFRRSKGWWSVLVGGYDHIEVLVST